MRERTQIVQAVMNFCTRQKYTIYIHLSYCPFLVQTVKTADLKPAGFSGFWTAQFGGGLVESHVVGVDIVERERTQIVKAIVNICTRQRTYNYYTAHSWYKPSKLGLLYRAIWWRTCRGPRGRCPRRPAGTQIARIIIKSCTRKATYNTSTDPYNYYNAHSWHKPLKLQVLGGFVPRKLVEDLSRATWSASTLSTRTQIVKAIIDLCTIEGTYNASIANPSTKSKVVPRNLVADLSRAAWSASTSSSGNANNQGSNKLLYHKKNVQYIYRRS